MNSSEKNNPATAKLVPGNSIGRFKIIHALPKRVRLKSRAIMVPGFDPVYFQALLEATPGVEEVRINTQGGSLILAFDGLEETWNRICEYLQTIPQEAYLPAPAGGRRIQSSDVALKVFSLFIGIFLPRPIRTIVSWTTKLDILLDGLTTLLDRGVKVEVLDALAVGVCLLQGNYFAAGAISTLLTLGEYLEGRSEERSSDLLKSLLRPQAEHLWVVKDGVEIQVPAKSVHTGDKVVCGAGEAIAVDGTVLEGEALVNQSSISGESVPVHLKSGDAVISGSVIEEGKLIIHVDRVGSETSVARIGRFIDHSLRDKSKKLTRSEELADKLVPVTLGLGGVVLLLTRDFRRLTSVLTVDFSCAVRLAWPIAIRSGMYAAGQAGVLLKGAPALDALESVDTIVFDKTGTLTTGYLGVTNILALQGLSEDELLCLAAGAEKHYDHPVARAVVWEAEQRKLTLPATSRVDFIVAHGVSAFIDGQNVLVGSQHFIAEDEGIACDELEENLHDLRAAGKTILYVARSGQLMGVIALRDEPRPEAAKVLELLKNDGIKRIIVLTGDHRETALALQRKLPQIDEIHYELKPESKASIVEELKQAGYNLAYVGDGVNDAPALVNAHVGICMPKGADLAKESAQVLLLKEDLYTLIYARQAAVRINDIINKCFLATVSINSLILVLATLGLSPVITATLHNSSTVGLLSYAALAASQKIELAANNT